MVSQGTWFLSTELTLQWRKNNKTATGFTTCPIIWQQLDLQNIIMSNGRQTHTSWETTLGQFDCCLKGHHKCCFVFGQNMGPGTKGSRQWHLQELNLIIHLRKFYTFSSHNSVSHWCWSFVHKEEDNLELPFRLFVFPMPGDEQILKKCHSIAW